MDLLIYTVRLGGRLYCQSEKYGLYPATTENIESALWSFDHGKAYSIAKRAGGKVECYIVTLTPQTEQEAETAKQFYVIRKKNGMFYGSRTGFFDRTEEASLYNAKFFKTVSDAYYACAGKEKIVPVFLIRQECMEIAPQETSPLIDAIKRLFRK